MDASFAIALAARSDQYHERARKLSRDIKRQQHRIVTTRAVVLEIGNALSKLRYREAAVRLLESIEDDSNIEVVPLSEDLFREAQVLYVNRPDKEWGLTDCVSFVVMQQRRITEALSTDSHFIQAGFKALLLEV